MMRNPVLIWLAGLLVMAAALYVMHALAAA
jgi:hypothetical protein